MRDSLGRSQSKFQRGEAMRLNLHHFLECIQAGKTDQEIAKEFDVHLGTIQKMRKDADLSSSKPYVKIGEKDKF